MDELKEYATLLWSLSPYVLYIRVCFCGRSLSVKISSTLIFTVITYRRAYQTGEFL